MSLFRKKPQPAPEAAAAPETIKMESTRLGPVFLQMYQWVLSVNLNRNVYRLECGTALFAGQPIPTHGRWTTLVEQMVAALLPEYQAQTQETFSIPHLTSVFSSGKTRASVIAYYDEGTEAGRQCLHIWLERIPQKNSREFSAIAYARLIQNENDIGQTYHAPQPIERTADNSIDWNAVWMHRVLRDDCPRYEYDVLNDTFYLHTGRQETSHSRVWTRFLGSLESRSDVFLSHDSISLLRALIQKGLRGEESSAVIGIRMGIHQGSSVVHYEMSCHTLTEDDRPSWLFGSLRNVEEQYRRQKQIQDIALELGSVFEHAFEGLHVIDTEKDTICSLVRSEGSYILDERVKSYSAFLKQRMDNGTVAPESIPNVQKLLQKGFLDRKAAHQAFEMDFLLKLPGKMEYTWYVDTFMPMENKPHRYLLTRRDVSAIYAAKQREFAYAESQRVAQYNESMLDTLAGLVEFRNAESGSHIAHVRVISRILMEDIARRSPQYNMTPRMIDMYTSAATMHDVGKITIPDAILNKTGRLTPEEYAQMKLHSTNGAQIIRGLNIPGQDDLKECCYQVALHHHERWDGNGYPDGLVGDNNNIYVQAIGLADVFDALVSNRCYKDALSFEHAAKVICRGECGAFNPRVLESFTHCLDALTRAYETATPQKKDEVSNGE